MDYRFIPPNTKILVVLTQYKRKHLEKQLKAIYNQSIKPEYVVVFQNENHAEINDLKDLYPFIHIKSDYNTKYFGRFAACFTFPVDTCIVMDDDIIPGRKCLENYINESYKLNSIILGNSRNGYFNKSEHMRSIPDYGIRNISLLTMFGGHIWAFKKDWLHYMFTIKPFTYETAEDMHFSFSAKILGNISSYCGRQRNMDESCDITNNSLACDQFSSYTDEVTTPLRKNVEKYFMENFGLKHIEKHYLEDDNNPPPPPNLGIPVSRRRGRR